MKFWLFILAATVFLLPLSENFEFGLHPLDIKRLFQIAVVLFGLSCILFRQRSLFSQPKQQIFALALLALPAVSTAMASQPALAFTDLANFIGVLACCLLYASNPNALKHSLWLACAASSAYLIVALSHLVSSILIGADLSVIPRLPGFSNIRFFGHWQTWTLPLIGALPIFRRYLPSIPKYWLWILAICWWFLFYIAAGRGTALGTLVAAITILIIAPQITATWFKTLVTCALAGNLLGWLWISYESTIFISWYHADGGILSSSSAGRLELWKTSLKAFSEAPWLGHGSAQFSTAIAPYASHPLGSPHNYVLLYLVEFGVLGATPILVGIGLAAISLLNGIQQTAKVNSDDALLTLAVFAACIAALVHGLFSGIQLAPYSQLWLIVMVGTTIRQLRYTGVTSHAEQSPLERVLVITLICILIMGVWLCAINPDIPDPWLEFDGIRNARFWSFSSF